MAVTDKLKGMVEELRRDLKAKMKRGVLQVSMPKLEEQTSRGRKIPINRDDT